MANKIGFNPWLSMWTKPKATIRKIIEFNPNYRLFLLAAIYGFVSLVSSSQSFSLGQTINFFTVLFLCLIVSPLWGYVIFSISSFFIYFTGKWLKGAAKYKEVRACIAWSNVPMIGNVILWVFLLLIFKQDLLNDFPGSYPITSPQRGALFAILLAQMILSIWVIVLYINSLAEVQMFSVGKAILNIIISVLFFIAIFFVISIVYFLILKGLSIK